ncbi:S-adenosyl-L-methionine methyltransferase [Rhizobium sp. NFR07]|uniref:class I SAM-dependent methyltransferase n=1 Tax=Rhizobium sp. NFR07 TaxID=1566262 RepID=UPI0008E471E3|nr:class I SAM-dependent methyltransferase [Rhizobium sp. NFR07]SFA92173.1 S-adenosyl-L-methionine methyltransferase [Rhizobium sp. NFR07]
MSRLDTFISRMSAQRDILNHVAHDLGLPPEGAILEVGLGNGRTYSHLRQLFPDRRIVAFDRALNAHRTTLPQGDDFVLGEINETGRNFAGSEAALVHADIGTGYPESEAVIMSWLPQIVADMLQSGGVAVSGLSLSHPQLQELQRLPTVEEGRYHMYRKI